MEEKTVKSVYISGKITGTDDYVERFEAAEKKLSEKGYAVINPVKIPGISKLPYADLMAVCKKHVEEADYLYLLDGWTWSKGAIVEMQHFFATHGREDGRVYFENGGEMPDAE